MLAIVLAAPAMAQVPLPDAPDQLVARVPFEPIATVFAEDFEVDQGGFTVGGNMSWTRGVPNAHVQPEVGQGPNAWGTNLDGSYEDWDCGWVQSPPIDLTAYPPGAQSGINTARLLFRHWYHFEESWDGGLVQASPDGGATWLNIAPQGGYDDRMIHSKVRACLGTVIGEPVYTGPRALPQPDAWRVDQFDLSPFMGQEILLRWIAGADHRDTRLGWYIDDVIVEVGAGAFVAADLPDVDGEQGVAYTPLATLYAADFAADDAGWTASGSPAWQWGEPSSPPHPPVGGLNVWGTNVAGAYPMGACASLTSPPILLPGADTAGGLEVAKASFQLWRHTASGYDGAVLQVSADGGASWARVVPDQGYDRALSTLGDPLVRGCLGVSTSQAVWSGPGVEPRAEEWLDYTADLTAYMGEEVMLRFVFASDGVDSGHRGVYVANMLVQAGAGGSANPTRPPTLQPPGWTVVGTNPSWAWGFPTAGPFSARPVWATNPDGAYNANECSAIVSDPIDTRAVVGLGRLTLSFEHFFEGDWYDYAVVQASADDGATWTTLSPFGGYPSSVFGPARTCLDSAYGWRNAVTGSAFDHVDVNAQAFDGETVRFRFAFASDGSTQRLGWHIRDAHLHRGTPARMPLMTASSNDPLGLKGDETLRDVGDGLVALIVTGQPHRDVASLAHLSRDVLLETLDARAAAFTQGVAETAALFGGEVVDAWGFVPAVKVVVPAAALSALAMRDDVRTLTRDSDDAVRLVEPLPPTDEESGLGALNSQGRKMLEAEDIWALGWRGEGVKLAVIDTGIDPSHEAFRLADGTSRVAKWVDYYGGVATPYDDHGHGTHVAGTAVGSDHYDDPTFGRFQEVGVAPEATLYVAKFLSGGGSGSLANAINSLQWAYAEGADISSNSWGSSCSSGGIAVMQAVRTLTDAGMASVFAAGNSGSGSYTIGGPACSESAITVGAITGAGTIAGFSSRGPCRDIELDLPYRICPDIVAKGAGVRSAIPRTGASWADPTGYRTWDGTSMATPHIAGAVALIEQMRRDMLGDGGWNTSARQEEQALKAASYDLGIPGEDDAYGWGLPKLTRVHALLLTEDALVSDSFNVSRDVLWSGDALTVSFSVRNDAVPAATGTFRVTLTEPDGDVVALADEPVALGLLEQKSFTDVLRAGSATAAGVYSVRASFDYEWVNRATGATHTARVEHVDDFEVRRPDVEVTLSGFATDAPLLAPQDIEWTGTSVGNEPARSVVVEFTLPDGYVFLPQDASGVGTGTARYATPAPTEVRENRDFGRVTLIWNVGDLANGESFSFTSRVAPTELGQQRAISVAKFHDGSGTPRAQSDVALQNVGLGMP